MKSVILTIIFALLAMPCYAGVVMMGSGVPVAAGDDCSGDMVASFHFEDTVTHNTTVGTPAGCVASGLTATYALTGGATYTATYFTDGANGIEALTEDDAVEWTHGGVDLTEVGTWCGDVRFNGTSNGYAMTINITTTAVNGQVVYDAGGNTLKMVYGGSNYTGSDTFANDVFTRICFSWDESQAASSDKLAVKVGTNAWQESAGITLTDVAQDAVIDPVGGHNFQYHRARTDNVKLYNVYKKVE